MVSKKEKVYAYLLARSGKAGICDSWSECETLVSGKKARYRGFKTRAEAESWLKDGAIYEKKVKPKLQKGIYFDAGTGRGQGVELKVTDERGKSLLGLVLAKKKITEYDTHRLKGVTNNYGELLACKFAIQAAKKKKVKKIFGDSRLVIDYWSKGYIKKKKLPTKTIDLAESIVKLREKFEKQDGKIIHISGDHNPADLGFHR